MFSREHQAALDAVAKAGVAVRELYKDRKIVEMKGEDNPLAEADLASNAILEEVLRGAFPDFGWLSEESVDDPVRLTKSHTWIVDPVDGTREFTLGIPEFVISVGLAVNGKATVGALYNPIRDQLFSGIVGVGAWFNNEACRVTTHAQLDGAKLVASRSEMKKGWFDDYLDRMEIDPCGSVAYKFGLVGAGLADATFTPKPRNEWDICGGVAVVTAAGGRCTDGSGTEYGFNRPDPLHHGICCTNGAIHPEIFKLVNR